MLPLLNGRLVERLRTLFNLRRTYVDDPVVESAVVINDELAKSPNIVIENSQTGAGTTTIFTTQTENTNTYMTHAQISFIKTATDGSVDFSLSTKVGGRTVELWHYTGTATALEKNTIAIDWAFPVKIDSGATIDLIVGAGAGTAQLVGTIFLYEEHI